MEDPRVLHAAHQKILRLIADGKVTGLRIDHPDGLLDPAAYFHRLQRAAADALSSTGFDQRSPLFYIAAEKILSRGEFLPDNWPVAGTTGYGFLNALNGLFVESDHDGATLPRLAGRRRISTAGLPDAHEIRRTSRVRLKPDTTYEISTADGR